MDVITTSGAEQRNISTEIVATAENADFGVRRRARLMIDTSPPNRFSLTYKEFPLKHFQALFLSISLAIAGVCTAHAQEVTSVVKIISGTVFTVSSGDTISLLGVGIPPSGTFDLGDATKHLKKIIGGEEVKLISDPSLTDPPGGAKPRYVYLLDRKEKMVNLQMIADRYGRVATEPEHSLLSNFMKEGGIDDSEGETASAPTPGTSQFNTEIKDLLDITIDIVKKRGSSSSSESQSYSTEPSGSVRCTGTTTKGVRCKLMTKDPSGRCRYHKGK